MGADTIVFWWSEIALLLHRGKIECLSPHTHLWTKFCASHSGTTSLIYLWNFHPERKKNNMTITVALHDHKSLSFLESISPAVFHYPPKSQVSWAGTNSSMLLWIYCFCSRVNIDFQWSYFCFIISLSSFPSDHLSGCRCLNGGKSSNFWNAKTVSEKISGLASLGKVRYFVWIWVK